MSRRGARTIGHQPDTSHLVRYRLYLVLVACLALMTAMAFTLAALATLQSVQKVITMTQREADTQDWSRFGYDATASRNNPRETTISADTVHRLHVLWRTTLLSVADSTPAFLHRLPFPDGTTRDVLYVTTRDGSLIALDSDSGSVLWQRFHATSDPNKVTTSSPYADAAHKVIYGYGMDGKVHKYDATTGAELSGGGWPVAVTTMKDSEKVSSALNANRGYLYVTLASFGGDAPPYQGHVVAIDLATASTHVFNAICSDRQHLLAVGECQKNGAGIWARPGVVIDPLTGNLFLATGNGPFTADKGGHDWGDSVIELSPDTSTVVDSYTPQDPDSLYEQDQDLGSSAPALLPTIPRSATPHLAIQTGKDAVVRLLNRDDLSGRGGPGHIGGELQTLDAPGHCPVLTQPAVWTQPGGDTVWAIIASGCTVGGYRVQVARDGSPSLQPEWTVPVGATSPMIANGVVFVATTGTKEVLALDPRTGRQLWTSGAARAGGTIDYTHWENPIVVNGRLYCSDEAGSLLAYGL